MYYFCPMLTAEQKAILAFARNVGGSFTKAEAVKEEEEMEVQNMVDQMGVGYNATHGAKITGFLLSRHFDLFGWIEAGLAIDKTK
jgi:hypothetical protein